MAAPALPASRRDDYRALYDEFRWHVPEHFNLADVCCGRWARSPAGWSERSVVSRPWWRQPMPRSTVGPCCRPHRPL